MAGVVVTYILYTTNTRTQPHTLPEKCVNNQEMSVWEFNKFVRLRAAHLT